MIQATESKLHWNYFIALERDLETTTRYVEFTPANFSTYSIEFAHLLFAARTLFCLPWLLSNPYPLSA
jgi:hypothetical protein